MIIKAIETVSTIMLLIGVGVIISHLGWYKLEHKSFLSNLIINVSVPSVVIRTFFRSFPRKLLLSSGKLMLIVLVTIVSVYIISVIASSILKLEPGRKASFESMSTLSNIMFIGLPVSISVFGEESAAYVMIYYMVANILLWTVFAPKFKIKSDLENHGFMEKVKETLKNLISIPLVTLFLSIILAAIGFKMPEIIINTADYLGGMSTPLSLIFIGGVIYEVGIKNIRIERDGIIIIIIRFIMAPVVTFLIGKFVGLDDLSLQVFTVLAGMPPMTQLGVVASAAGNEDEEFIMTNISFMTILSLLFIPIYLIIMPNFL